MTHISHISFPIQTDWEQKTLGEKCVIKSRRRATTLHNHPEEIQTSDDTKPLIIFSFDMDNTLIYDPKTLDEKEEDLEENNMYEKIHASFLAQELLDSLEKFISCHIPMLPILVTSSTLNRVENILYETESTSNVLEDIFTPEQIFARGTFNSQNPFEDITKKDPNYSEKFIKKLQERKLIAVQDNIHIVHFGDKIRHDKAFIDNLNQYSKEHSSSVKITGTFFGVNLKNELYRILSKNTIEDTDKENAEDSMATHIIVEIEDMYDIYKEKFEILKNNKRPSEESTSSSHKKMKTDYVQNIL